MWEAEMGSLYSLSTDLNVIQHVGKITLSNGMGWTADDRTMFYIDSKARKVWAYDFDIQAGSISKEMLDSHECDFYVVISNNGGSGVCYCSPFMFVNY